MRSPENLYIQLRNDIIYRVANLVNTAGERVPRSNMKKIAKKTYKLGMLTLISSTDIFSRVGANLDDKMPGKWCYITENMTAFSSIAHCKLSEAEEDFTCEYIEKEDILKKKLGRKKFYSEEELDELKKRRKGVQI